MIHNGFLRWWRVSRGSDDVVGGASGIGAGLRDDVCGAIGAGVCDGLACGVCGIRAGTCDTAACVVLAVLAPWVIPAVLVILFPVCSFGSKRTWKRLCRGHHDGPLFLTCGQVCRVV